jgi:predicted AAA+ superfamily ATPase
MYHSRLQENTIIQSIQNFPVTALLGPRQCGKSTLIKHIIKTLPLNSVYLDLEKPSDLEKLNQAEWYLNSQKDKLICIDEIQRLPNLFPLIRSLVDEWDKPGCFIILGSASRDLLMQSSESLAGRIVYHKLQPFLWNELPLQNIEEYFVKGGFPRSFFAPSNNIAQQWKKSFISTFLERDLKQWLNFTPITMRRLWQMLAHVNGQTINYSTLSNSLGVSNQTIKNYIDLLQSTYMVDSVPAYNKNFLKRLVKAPKVYIIDPGITATLLGLSSFDEIAGHPAFGSIWEGIVLMNIRGHFPDAEIYHYRTSNGNEIDFVLQEQNKVFLIECKASYSPKLSKGNHIVIEDIQPLITFIVQPSNQTWTAGKNIQVVNLSTLITQIQNCL